MTDAPTHQASGRDLARQALAAYKQGRTPGQAPGPARSKTRRIREDGAGGREPNRLGGVLGRLATEQGWKTSLDGGSVIDQWPTICPDRYRGHLEPVAYDPERGRLDLCPGSHTYATELRMFGPMLAKELNTKMGRDVVRTIRVLPVGAVAAVAPAAKADGPQLSRRDNSEDAPAAEPPGPLPRDPRYQAALGVLLEHKPDRTRHLNPKTAAAIEGSTAALLDPVKREPEEKFTDAVAAAERLAEQHARQHPDDPLLAAVQAALEFKRSGGSTKPVRRLFESS